MISSFYMDEINMEAGAWLARCQAGELSAEDQAAFQLWLASDHAHAMAFEHATNVWDRLGAISREAYVPKKTEAASVMSRRALIAGAAVTTVFGSGALFLRKAQALNYETAVGEQKRINLDDGMQLILDTNTSLAVVMSDDRCIVDLRYGRINCRNSQNNGQLNVKVGKRVIVANRSVFDVLNSGEYFSVVLIDGNAEVTSSSAIPVALSQGERAAAPDGKPLLFDKPNISSLTAWQTGRLVFKDETVHDAIEEMNRYSTVKIEADDTYVASLRVSGGYVVGDSFGFAVSLSRLLPIEVRQVGGKIKLVRNSDI
jgi:transmembrane sensor